MFKSIVKRVILGGEDKDGNPEPYMLTFFFKTGFETKIDAPNPKGEKGKKSQANECSHRWDGTYRMYGVACAEKLEVKINLTLT